MFKWNMTRYSIYVGLNDAVTHEQEYRTAKYINIMKNVCQAYHVAFSFSVIHGNYMHEDGKLTDETTLCVSFLDEKEETIREIAHDLCTFFNQESVIITEEPAKMYYLRGDNEIKDEMYKRSDEK